MHAHTHTHARTHTHTRAHTHTHMHTHIYTHTHTHTHTHTCMHNMTYHFTIWCHSDHHDIQSASLSNTNLWHPLCKHKNIWGKIFFLHWPICLEQFAWNTPPLLKPPSRRTCLTIISKLFFTAVLFPCPVQCVCVVSVIVKCPVLPPCTVGGRSRNPLYYYYDYYYTVLLYLGKA